MVVRTSREPEVDLLFHALADATRRDILTRVLEREQSMTVLAMHYDMSFAAVQKHVAVLERASLVRKMRRGREQRVSGAVDALGRARDLLGEYERLWRHRAAAIERLLDDEGREGKGS